MTVATLTATSPHATAGPPALIQPVASPVAVLEYEPPPLPVADAFRVAAAGDLPPVPLTYDTARRVWRLLADYSYEYDGVTLTVKAGYAYDLASVPRPLWWLIAPNELSLVAPLFHDLLYEYRGVLPAESAHPYRTFCRRESDDLFLHLMEAEGIAWWRRSAAYSAVRAFGWTFWNT